MKSWKLKNIKKLELSENTNLDNTLDNDMAKVKISISNISPSDISAFIGNYEKITFPVSLGRSAIGFISESTNTDLKKGQKVFLSPYRKNKFTSTKIAGLDFDGYLADYVITQTSNIYELPDGISTEAATFIDDIALVNASFEKLKIETSKYILLIGASALNCIAAQLAIYKQAIPIILDSDGERLQNIEKFGIYYTINSTIQDPNQRIHEITAGRGVDAVIFDTDCFDDAFKVLDYIGKEGKLCLMGFNKRPNSLAVDVVPLIKNEITIFGSNTGEGFISMAINQLINNVVKVDNLIDETYDFENTLNAFKSGKLEKSYYKNIIKC